MRDPKIRAATVITCRDCEMNLQIRPAGLGAMSAKLRRRMRGLKPAKRLVETTFKL